METITTCKGFGIGDTIKCLDNGYNHGGHPRRNGVFMREGDIGVIAEFDLPYDKHIVAIMEDGSVVRLEEYIHKFELVSKAKKTSGTKKSLLPQPQKPIR